MSEGHLVIVVILIIPLICLFVYIWGLVKSFLDTKQRLQRRTRRIAQLTHFCQRTGSTSAEMDEAFISTQGERSTYFEKTQIKMLRELRRARRSCRKVITIETRNHYTSPERIALLHQLRITLEGQYTTCSGCRQRLSKASSFSCALENNQETAQQARTQPEQQTTQQTEPRIARMTEDGHIEL